MSLQINCRKIVGGSGKGKALVTHQPINFLTMINAKKGTIDQRNHELFGQILKGIVLVLPYAVGSSVGAYTIYSLKANRLAPAAIICTEKADITTASGCAISNIPAVDLLGTKLSLTISSGFDIEVDSDKERIIIKRV